MNYLIFCEKLLTEIVNYMNSGSYLSNHYLSKAKPGGALHGI